MSLAREIAKQRAKKDLTMREAAQLAKLSHNAVWRAEQGDADMRTMVRIAHALRVPVAKMTKAIQADARRLVAA